MVLPSSLCAPTAWHSREWERKVHALVVPQHGVQTCLRHKSRHRCWETLLGSSAWALHWTKAVIAFHSYFAQKRGTLMIIKCLWNTCQAWHSLLPANKQNQVITLTSISPKSDRYWQRGMLGKDRRSWRHSRKEGRSLPLHTEKKAASIRARDVVLSVIFSSLHLPKALQKSGQSLCTRVEGSHWHISTCVPDMPVTAFRTNVALKWAHHCW